MKDVVQNMCSNVKTVGAIIRMEMEMYLPGNKQLALAQNTKGSHSGKAQIFKSQGSI